MKIAIIVRSETLDKCTGKGCLRAFFGRLDSFALYAEDAQLVGFTQDGGDLEKKIAKLKQLGVDVVHLSSCIRSKRDDYEALAKRLSQDFAVVGYTHGSFAGRTRQAICFDKGGAPVGVKGRVETDKGGNLAPVLDLELEQGERKR